MHPVLLRLPSLDLRILAAPTMVCAGYALALWVAPRLAAAADGIDERGSRRACLILAVAVLLGGRLAFVMSTPALFVDAPWRALAVWDGGRHAAGAVAALLLVGPVVMRAYRVPFLRFADSGSVAVGLALATARIGCFLHGCCVGTTCAWPWCIGFPPTAPIYNLQAPQGLLPPGALRSLPVHPLQLYFAAAALATSALAWWLLPRRRYPGQAMFTALVLYGASSAALESLRYDYAGRAYWGAWPQLTWAAGALGAAGLVALIGGDIACRRRRYLAEPVG